MGLKSIVSSDLEPPASWFFKQRGGFLGQKVFQQKVVLSVFSLVAHNIATFASHSMSRAGRLIIFIQRMIFSKNCQSDKC